MNSFFIEDNVKLNDITVNREAPTSYMLMRNLPWQSYSCTTFLKVGARYNTLPMKLALPTTGKVHAIH